MDSPASPGFSGFPGILDYLAPHSLASFESPWFSHISKIISHSVDNSRISWHRVDSLACPELFIICWILSHPRISCVFRIFMRLPDFHAFREIFLELPHIFWFLLHPLASSTFPELSCIPWILSNSLDSIAFPGFYYIPWILLHLLGFFFRTPWNLTNFLESLAFSRCCRSSALSVVCCCCNISFFGFFGI